MSILATSPAATRHFDMNIAAAKQKKRSKSRNTSKRYIDTLSPSRSSIALTAQINLHSPPDNSNSNANKNPLRVDDIVNKKWEKLIPLLDSMGIPINRTIKDLLKLYPKEKVESAVALLRARKRESYIPNPSGYFVSALKADWASSTLIDELGDELGDRTDRDREQGDAYGYAIANRSKTIDTAPVFRHWYDLARELGYCSGGEVRNGVQWVCLSGTWERWQGAVERGYSLDYLKKIMKRNKGN